MSSRSGFIKGIVSGFIIASIIIIGTNIYFNQSTKGNINQAIMNLPANTTVRSIANQFSPNPLEFAPLLLAIFAGLFVFLLLRRLNESIRD